MTQAPDAPRPSGGHDSSLVPILTNQRDRYRRRGQELEEVHAGPGHGWSWRFDGAEEPA